MPERIPNGVAKLVVFRAYSSADHVTPATGKTIAITISKNGAAFGNPNAGATNATEISSGFYKFTLDTTDTGTNGPLAYRGAVSGIDDVGDVFEVVAATNGGFSALPAVASGSAGAVITSGTGTAQLSVSSGLVTLAGVTHTGAVIPTVTTLTGHTAQTGDTYARLGAPAGASVSADIAAVKVDTAAILADTGTDGVVVAAGSKTGYSLTATTGLGNQTADITGTVSTVTTLTNLPAITANWLTASGLATDAVNEIADGLLDRNMATGTDSGSPTVRTVRQALRALRNKLDPTGGTLTVYKEDDATASWTAALTTDAGADPITGVDPAGP